MARLLDCLVNYFGLDENERPGCRRYFCYHIVAGPGPTDGTGVAVVMMLAVADENQRCTSRQTFYAVETGGPEAAIAAAIRYLDAWHQQERVQKVQSALRGHCDKQSAAAARSPHHPSHTCRGRGVSQLRG